MRQAYHWEGEAASHFPALQWVSFTVFSVLRILLFLLRIGLASSCFVAFVNHHGIWVGTGHWKTYQPPSSSTLVRGTSIWLLVLLLILIIQPRIIVIYDNISTHWSPVFILYSLFYKSQKNYWFRCSNLQLALLWAGQEEGWRGGSFLQTLIYDLISKMIEKLCWPAVDFVWRNDFTQPAARTAHSEQAYCIIAYSNCYQTDWMNRPT